MREAKETQNRKKIERESGKKERGRRIV